MDVVMAIMNDHRVLEGLFAELHAGKGDRAVLVAEVRARLLAHSRAEERQVYSVLARVLPAEVAQAYQGAHEHRQAEERLAAVESATPEEFPRALAEFVAVVGRHVAEEEAGILPALRQAMSLRKRDELGRRFEAHRLRELKHAGIDDSLTKEDLYILAQRAGIPGRSSMSKEELARALLARRLGRPTS